MENPGKEISSSIELYADEKEFMIISIDDEPEVGEVYHVKIEFRNTIKKIESGFYESSFIDEVLFNLFLYRIYFNILKFVKDGDTHYLATTQFQPTGARRAFPCFDEPNLKATFSFSSKLMIFHCLLFDLTF